MRFLEYFDERLNEGRGITHASHVGDELQDLSSGHKYVLDSIERFTSPPNVSEFDEVRKFKKESNNGFLLRCLSSTSKLALIIYTTSDTTSPKDVNMKWAKSSEGLKVKPQDFEGVVGKEYDVKTFVSNVMNSIDNRIDLPEKVKMFLKAAVEATTTGSSREYATLAKELGSDLAQVEKNFGEILAAIEAAKQTRNGYIFIPEAGNYPLIDFMIRTKDGDKKYSVKADASTTNVIKLKDIADLFQNKNDEISKIIEILSTSSIKMAPYDLADMFGIKYDSSNMDDGAQRYAIEKAAISVLNGDKYVKIFEKTINEFLKVKYVMVNLRGSKPSFSIKEGSDLKVKFRSKNSTNGWKDRIGLQIK
ncbi:MAG TPA: hypothetical protein PLA71_00705 [Saccharofermentans sp.]|nr:hypothetical protein [Saccharofermentans sp.]